MDATSTLLGIVVAIAGAGWNFFRYFYKWAGSNKPWKFFEKKNEWACPFIRHLRVHRYICLKYRPCLAISKVRAWWLSQVETWLIHQLLPPLQRNGNVPAVPRFFVKQFYLGIILVGYLTYHVRQQFLESLC